MIFTSMYDDIGFWAIVQAFLLSASRLIVDGVSVYGYARTVLFAFIGFLKFTINKGFWHGTKNIY